ncbi:hypothetical protein YC2023_082807 [Brassica napus]
MALLRQNRSFRVKENVLPRKCYEAVTMKLLLRRTFNNKTSSSFNSAQAAIPVDVHDNSNSRLADPPPRGYPFLHESMQMQQKPLARKLALLPLQST